MKLSVTTIIHSTPEVNNQFEAEANYFASAALFQLHRFDDDISALELGIKSPMHLADKYGGSKHAAIRRYVERSPKRCSLLILERADNLRNKVKSYFQSTLFTKTFGEIKWPEYLGPEWTFSGELLIGKRKLILDGQFGGNTKNGMVTFSYHYFYNTYTAFVLIMLLWRKKQFKNQDCDVLKNYLPTYLPLNEILDKTLCMCFSI